MQVENMILGQLVADTEYLRKTLPYLKPDYFMSRSDRIIFEEIRDYVEKYNAAPTKPALDIAIEDRSDLTEDEVRQIMTTSEEMFEREKESNLQWALDTTEQFCQDKALYNAITRSIRIYDGKDNADKGALPEILSEALGVSFDTNIGHDYLADSDARYDFYHSTVSRIPFDLEYLNDVTRGGLPRRTLNIALAGTNVGKSLFMVHCAAANLRSHKDVLYITLELQAEKVAQRIDANLMNVTMDEVESMLEEVYKRKMDKLRSKARGRLFIKEYPTACAGASHFRHLLNELRLKKNFVPDIIYIDYLNICTSSRIKAGASVGSYTYIKAIAEELRGLAVEYDVPVVSATQTTRAGFTSSDIGLEDTSESFGLPATADFMFALISSEELDELGQIQVKQLKSRYDDVGRVRRFLIGVDKPKMKLFDVENEAQSNIIGGPVFDQTEVGKGITDISELKKSLSGFK